VLAKLFFVDMLLWILTGRVFLRFQAAGYRLPSVVLSAQRRWM
jgi:hypothetical protein